MQLKLDRRQFLVAGASVAALGLAGRPAWAADLSLRVAWWGGKERAERTQKALDLYAKSNSGVTISTEYRPISTDARRCQLQNQQQSGNGRRNERREPKCAKRIDGRCPRRIFR